MMTLPEQAARSISEGLKTELAAVATYRRYLGLRPLPDARQAHYEKLLTFIIVRMAVEAA